jgi:hypothetical protein
LDKFYQYPRLHQFRTIIRLENSAAFLQNRVRHAFGAAAFGLGGFCLPPPASAASARRLRPRRLLLAAFGMAPCIDASKIPSTL